MYTNAFLKQLSPLNLLLKISASSEQQTASMEEITSTANKLGNLAEDLKTTLLTFGGDNGARKEKSEGRVSKLSAMIKNKGKE